MGQKINMYTLRSDKFKINNLNIKPKECIHLYSFIKTLEYFFWHKKIFLTDTILYSIDNTIFFKFFIYFRLSKLKYYDNGKKYKPIKEINFWKLLSIKKVNMRSRTIKKRILPFKIENSLKRIFNSFKFLKKNIINYKFNNLNILISEKHGLFLRCYYYFKKDATLMFPRRINFFLEFIQLSLLFRINKISVNFYIRIIVEIFRILQKKRHAKFFIFIDKFFKYILDLLSYDFVGNSRRARVSNLLGIKIKISGKLKGKPRSNHYSKIFGNVPIQTISSPISYAKAHANTVYGVFGIQLWVYRSLIY